MKVSLDSVDPPGLLATVIVLVTAGLHQVDLAAGREAAVDVVLWHEPDGGPDPASEGEAGFYLHPPVLETELVLGRTRLSFLILDMTELLPWSPGEPAVLA